MTLKERAMQQHRDWAGKLEITARASVNNAEELSIAYTPGVAEPCLAIRDDYSQSFTLTRRWNTVGETVAAAVAAAARASGVARI